MYRIGFDIGGTNLKLGIVDEHVQIVAESSISFPKGENFSRTIEIMAGEIDKLSKGKGIDINDCKSIGIATAGSIDLKKGVILNAYNLGFHNVPIIAEMKKYFPDMSVSLANDADAAALGELHAGAFRGKKSAVLITLGTGVGGGIIIDGRIYSGGRGNGNELGHMIIMQGGPICTCGNRGCIESLCTATWLIQQGRRAVVENPLSLIYLKAGGDMDKVSAKTVVDSAKEGDAVAMDIFNTYVDSLSSAITSVISLLDPEIVAVGGGISLAGDFLFEPLRDQVKQKTFFKIDYEIVPTQLGNKAGIIGAALL